ncbi:three component ABC system middle component [Pseudomonas edaphica]|uniref:three component ABC system middle component n=1 Tax=Pseudomonas edaphica TaxID=2006980 RepID=UPI003D1421E8
MEPCKQCCPFQTKTSSAIDNVLRDTPILKIDLELRVQEYAASTLQGLNPGVATKLIEKEPGEDGDVFTSLVIRWPKGTKASIPAEMLKTTKQLSSWLASVSTPQIYKLLFGIPNEIRD